MPTSDQTFVKLMKDFQQQLGRPLSSRIHRLNSFGSEVFVKRDDELSFGCSGSKYRKLQSLTQHWRLSKINKVFGIGGGASNHVVSALQCLNEEKIDYEFWLLASHSQQVPANRYFIELLGECDKFHWLSRTEWSQVETEVRLAMAADPDNVSFLMPEGGACLEALLGAMTLGYDIFANMNNSGMQFSQIILDAGTGFTFAALALALSNLGYQGSLEVVTVGPENDVRASLKRCVNWGQQLGLNYSPQFSIQFHSPFTAKSFGAVNNLVFEEVKKVARQEGILIDPVYSAKLFGTARQILAGSNKHNKCLLIHSGGALNLSGYWHKMGLSTL